MDIIFLQRVPESLALLLTLALAFGSFGGLMYAVYLQIFGMLYICSDGNSCGHRCEGDTLSGLDCVESQFYSQVDNATADFREHLLVNYHMVLEDIEPTNSSVNNPIRVTFDKLGGTYGGVGAFLNEFVSFDVSYVDSSVENEDSSIAKV